MIRSKSLFLIALFFPIVLGAQAFDFDVVHSSQKKLKMGQQFGDVIHEHPQYIYTITRRSINGILEEKEIELEVFDKELKRVRSKSLSLEYKGNIVQYERLILMGDKLYLFTSYFNTSKKVNFLFAEVYDANSLKRLKRMEIVGQFESVNRFESGLIGFKKSFDKSKLLVYCQLASKKEDPERVYALVFGEGMEVEWERVLELGIEDRDINIFDYEVSINGDVFLLGLTKDINGKDTGKFMLSSFTNLGTEKHEYKLSFQNKIISDVRFKVNNTGELLIAGLYGLSSRKKAKGTVFFRIDPKSKKILASKTAEFSDDVLLEASNIRSQKRKEKYLSDDSRLDRLELDNFVVRELIPRSDGGLLMMVERFYVREYRSMNTGFYNGVRNNGTVSYTYHYEEIIVFNIRPDGSLDWSTMIPKYQSSINDGGFYLGYTYLVGPKGIFFVFNDMGNTRRSFEDGFSFRNDFSTPVIWRLGQDGSTDKRELSVLNNGIKIVPRFTKQVGSSKWFVYQGRKGNQQISLLKL